MYSPNPRQKNLCVPNKIGVYQFVFALLVTGLLCPRGAWAQEVFPSDTEVLRAMKDEMSRSLATLSIENLQKPYYLEYRLSVRMRKATKAMLGADVQTSNTHRSQLTVGIRVGRPEFDNTNFFDASLSFFGSGDDDESFRNRTIAVNPDYQTLRRELWLASDAAYKQAAEAYSKKEASYKNRMRTDTTHDFIPMGPESHVDTFPPPRFDQQYFVRLCRDASIEFLRYPKVTGSSVGVEMIVSRDYYVNSEGRTYVKSDVLTGFEAAGTAQASDGMPLANTWSAYSRNPGALPGRDSLISATRTMAANLNAFLEAKKLEEPYSGPVLFEGQAAAEMFTQFFAPNLVTQRRQANEGGFQDIERNTAFQNKIGGRVLPEFFSLESNPLLQNINAVELVGSYKIDDDGVPSQKVSLVERGYLKNLLSTRVPTRRVKTSNGSQRGNAAMFSTLVLTASKDKQLEPKKLRQRLLGLAKNRELPYALVVRKALNINLLYTVVFNQTLGDFPYAQGDSKMSLLEVFKLYPDGREEPVRGCEAVGISVQTFKDILAAGNRAGVYNMYSPAVSSPFVSGGPQFLGTSTVMPDLLFEDMEVRTLDRDFPKPPYLESPLGSK